MVTTDGKKMIEKKIKPYSMMMMMGFAAISFQLSKNAKMIDPFEVQLAPISLGKK